MKKLLMLVALGAAHSLVMGGDDTVQVRVQKRVETDDDWTIRSYYRPYPDITTKEGTARVTNREVMSSIIVKKDTKKNPQSLLKVYKNGSTLVRIFKGKKPTEYNFAAQKLISDVPAKNQMLVILEAPSSETAGNDVWNISFVHEYQTPMEKTKLPTVKVAGYKQLKTDRRNKWSVLTMTPDGEFISFTKFKKDTASITDTNPEILAEDITNVYVFKKDLSKEEARMAFDKNRGECGDQLDYVCTQVLPLRSDDARLVINAEGRAIITIKDNIDDTF